MRRLLSASLLCLGLLSPAAHGQTVFNQDFSAGSSLSTYTGSGANQIDYFSASPPMAINTGRLEINTVGLTSGEFGFRRTTDLAGISDGAILRMTITVGDISTQAGFQVGQLSFGDVVDGSGNTPPNAQTHSKIAIAYTDSSGDKIAFRTNANASGGSNSNSASVGGTFDIMFVVNNTGSTITYTAPTGASETLVNDGYDFWIGSTRAFNDIVHSSWVNSPSLPIKDFAFSTNAASAQGQLFFDNISVSALPEPSSLGLLALGAGAVLRRRRRQA